VLVVAIELFDRAVAEYEYAGGATGTDAEPLDDEVADSSQVPKK